MLKRLTNAGRSAKIVRVGLILIYCSTHH